MSEEYEIEHDQDNVIYTPFWPLVILLAGLFLWIIYQDYALNSQRIVFDKQFQNAVPTINAAQDAKAKLYSVAQDLIQTSAKDSYAAQIVKEAGIQMSGTNATTNPAEPPK